MIPGVEKGFLLKFIHIHREREGELILAAQDK